MKRVALLVLLLAACRTPPQPPPPPPEVEKPPAPATRKKRAKKPAPPPPESEQQRAERIARWETGARSFFSSQQLVLRACYEDELHRVEEGAIRGEFRDSPAPNLAGSLVLVIPVEPDGQVNEARIEENTLGNENVDACLLAEADSWNLPTPPTGETVEIELPLKFQLMDR